MWTLLHYWLPSKDKHSRVLFQSTVGPQDVFGMSSIRHVESEDTCGESHLNRQSVCIVPLWCVKNRVFAYNMFAECGESMIDTQQSFRCHFRWNFQHNGEIPSRNTILRWVNAFTFKGPIMKTKSPGYSSIVYTPQNMYRVTE